MLRFNASNFGLLKEMILMNGKGRIEAMTKEVFIKTMAQRGNIKQCEAEKYVNLFLDTLKYAIKECGGVKFVGFGKFFVKEHKEKIGRNMKTGEPMTIPKHKTVKFTVSDIFKNSLNE